ncbi:MAG: hypothetical protein ACTS2F_22725 [Thainema sp.]
MQYHDQLHPWVVYRRLPNCQNIAIARFRRRNEAEMYQIAVHRLMPNALFFVAFAAPAQQFASPPASATVEYPESNLDPT